MSNDNDNTNTLISYSWWGGYDPPPEHLKTKKQLSAMGFKPLEPVGVINCSDYDVYLYDPNDPNCCIKKRKATKKQLDALAKGREVRKYNQEFRKWHYIEGRFIQDKNSAILCAREYMKSKDKYVILDTETTGLSCAEIVEISIIDLEGNDLFTSLVKPTISIPDEVVNIHGITDQMVSLSPSFPDVYPKIKSTIGDKTVLIYNSDFDVSILSYCCKLHELKRLRFKSICIMDLYAQYCGEWSHYYESYKLQPLNGGHRSFGDCLATLETIKEMADSDLCGDIEKLFQEYYQS